MGKIRKVGRGIKGAKGSEGRRRVGASGPDERGAW